MRFLACLSLVLLTACASGAKYDPSMVGKPKAGMSKVVLYFPSSISGIVPMSLKIDNKNCSLFADGFTTADVAPGKTPIELGSDLVYIPTKAGVTHYVKVSQNMQKAQAAGAFGLVGLFTYNAITHGKKENADWFFVPVESGYAKNDMQGLQKSPPCE